LLFDSALRFIHLELFLVTVLISCAPVVGVLSFLFFNLGAPTVLLRAVYVTPCRILAVVMITSFSFLSEGAGVHALLWWRKGSPTVALGSTGSLHSGGIGLLTPAE
jgi:hypothetical protein